MNIKFKKTGLFVLICATALLCSRSVDAAGTSTLFFSWAYDNEWSGWTLNKVDNIGSNSGLRLLDEETGFATRGYITTKTSASGVAKWKRAVIESDSILYSEIAGVSAATVSLTPKFSTDNKTWKTIDELNTGKLSDSRDLYISVVFDGTATTSPVLKSLRVEYEVDSLGYSSINLEKKIFRVDTNADGSQKPVLTSTFVPGDMAVARIAITPKTAGIGATSLADYRPEAYEINNITNSDARKIILCGLEASDKIYPASFSSNSGEIGSSYSSWSDIGVAKDETYYFCYTYKIGVNDQAKNILSQSRLVLSASGGAEILSSSNNFMLIKGSDYLASDSSPKEYDLDGPTGKKYPIDDQLSPSFVSYSIESGGTQQTNPFYVYKRGFAGKSRGGNLLSLPAVIKSSGQEIAFDQFYLLYNPAFYLFGNIFSGESYAGNAIDFNSRFSAISNKDYAVGNKLNSQDALYNYYFDKNSVIAWGNQAEGGNDKYKNSTMKSALDSYTKSVGAPEDRCKLSSAGQLGSDGKPMNLQLNNCSQFNTNAAIDDTWPNGRMWYLKVTGDGTQNIDIGKSGFATNIYGRGTIFIDFDNGRSDNTVTINNLNFISSAKMGVVVTGGGVVFSKQARSFRGIVFNPRAEGASSGGKILFTKEGRMLKIYGSLVADEIEFNPRSRESAEYGIMIYNDAALMNQPLPGFEGINSLVTAR